LCFLTVAFTLHPMDAPPRCPQCGRNLYRKHRQRPRGRPRRYCDTPCQQRAYRARRRAERTPVIAATP